MGKWDNGGQVLDVVITCLSQFNRGYEVYVLNSKGIEDSLMVSEILLIAPEKPDGCRSGHTSYILIKVIIYDLNP